MAIKLPDGLKTVRSSPRAASQAGTLLLFDLTGELALFGMGFGTWMRMLFQRIRGDPRTLQASEF